MRVVCCDSVSLSVFWLSAVFSHRPTKLCKLVESGHRRRHTYRPLAVMLVASLSDVL